MTKHGRSSGGRPDVRPWPASEWKRAQSLKAKGYTLAEIGKRLGGRSRQSVRHKFREEKIKAAAGGANPIGSPAGEREKRVPKTGVVNPDLALLDAMMAQGGMSRARMQSLRKGDKIVDVLVGYDAPNGSPRPAGWRDGTPVELLSPIHRAHLADLQAWWLTERENLPQLSTATDDDG